MNVLQPIGDHPWTSRRHRSAALTHAASIARTGVWAEAGVADGWSARYLRELLPADGMLHLFDSFHGLPDDWNEAHPKGTFRPDEIPLFRDTRVLVVAGLYEFSLPAYVRACPLDIELLHVDCDLYDSAMTVLRTLGDRLKPGAVVAFDEAIGSETCERNEGRAMLDWQNEAGRVLRPVARTNYTQLVTVVDR